jgi:hypothetical protein
MKNSNRKEKLLQQSNQLKEKQRQIEAQLQQIQAREKQDRRKSEARLKIILGGIVLNKCGMEQLKSITHHLSDKDREWVQVKFPELLPPASFEQKEE